jgi:hypothetical protein
VASKRRLGFAIHLTSVRYLRWFMADPRQVPAQVVDCLADQPAISRIRRA